MVYGKKSATRHRKSVACQPERVARDRKSAARQPKRVVRDRKSAARAPESGKRHPERVAPAGKRGARPAGRGKAAAGRDGRRPPRSGAGAPCRERRRGHDDDPPVGHADLHRLADGEPGLLQPVAAEAEHRHGAGTDAFAIEALVVVVVADSETAGAGGDALACGHGGFSGSRSRKPSVQEGGRVLEHRYQAARRFPLSGVVWLRATRPWMRNRWAQKNRRLSDAVSAAGSRCVRHLRSI